MGCYKTLLDLFFGDASKEGAEGLVSQVSLTLTVLLAILSLLLPALVPSQATT